MVVFLKAKPILHMMMTECIRRGSADILIDEADGVLLFDRKSETHMIAAANQRAAETMLNQIDKPLLLAAHDEHSRALGKARFGFPNEMPCVQAVYEKPVIALIDADIRRLDRSAYPVIRAHYNNADDAYIMECIDAGMYGVYEDGRLAGFIGMHAEGSIGLLEILPAYRRRGYGEALVRYMTALQLDNGTVPFSQIKEENEASLAMHRKLHYTISEERLYWLM